MTDEQMNPERTIQNDSEHLHTTSNNACTRPNNFRTIPCGDSTRQHSSRQLSFVEALLVSMSMCRTAQCMIELLRDSMGKGDEIVIQRISRRERRVPLARSCRVDTRCSAGTCRLNTVMELSVALTDPD